MLYYMYHLAKITYTLAASPMSSEDFLRGILDSVSRSIVFSKTLNKTQLTALMIVLSFFQLTRAKMSQSQGLQQYLDFHR